MGIAGYEVNRLGQQIGYSLSNITPPGIGRPVVLDQ